MKKKLSLILALVMMVSLFPIVNAEAAYSNVSDAPQYIAEEFEDNSVLSRAEFPKGGLTGTTSSASWVQTGTHNDSKGAVQINPKNKAKLALFPWRVESGNTYHISAWVKFTKGASTNPDMSFILRGGSSDITIPASKSQSFASGTWVQITATYTATASIADGTIDFRIGTNNGMPTSIWNTTSSYTIVIDDFYVFPDVAPTTDDVVFQDSFEAETNVTSGLWTSHNTATLAWLSDDGANGTTGAMKITTSTTSNFSAPKVNPINFQFQKRYKLTFWAKALDETALDKTIKAIFTYATATATDPSVQNQPHVEYTSSEKLTNDWQKFEYDIQVSRAYTEETFPYMHIRIGDGTLKGVSFALDEISLTREGGENAGDVIISGQKSASTPDSIFYQMLVNDTRKTFLYRLYQETASGDVLLFQGQTKNGQLAFATSELPQDLDSLRLDVVGVNSTGGCSEVVSCYLKEAEQEDSMSIACDQYIWTKDVDTLSATVRYFNDSNPDSITAYVAQYDNEKRLLGVTPASKTVSAREDASWQVSANVFPTAVKAKFFAWYEDSVIPVTYSCEIEKTTSGEFIYVDAKSTATTADGSFAAPFKTISAAKDYLRTQVAASAETDFYVVLKGGEYTNNYETLVFTKEDGAPDGKTITYTSLDSDRAKITGAYHIPVGSFSLYDSSKNIWQVSVPAGTQTRQLYVNGIKATRARSKEDAIPFTNLDLHDPSFTGDSAASMYYHKEVMNAYAITTTDTSFLSYNYPTELELYFISNWRHQFICPDGVVSSTDADGNPVARFEFTTTQQKSDWQWLNRDNAPVQSVMYVENALELLDEPGEWYLDTHANILYYKPRDFETMSTVDVVIPKTETLIDVIGGLGYTAQNTTTAENSLWASNYNNPIQNIAFKNIDFEYTGWNLPTTNRSFRNGQNATFEDPARNPVEYNRTGGRLMAGAVEVKHGKNLTFDNCDFSKIGAMALKMIGAIENCAVTGNEFYEISGSAMNLGEVTGVDVKSPTGIAAWVNSDDHSQGVKSYMLDRHSVYNTLVANNYIHKVATDYYAAAAIGAGYPVNTTIRNNDLSDGAYCGIHIGWGWSTDPGMTSGFVIENNFIHNFMNWRLYDGAGIYALGGTRGGTTEFNKTVKDYPKNEMRENYIQDVYNLFGGLYYDNGSHGWEASDNVLDLSNYPILYGTENYLRPNDWLHTTSDVSDIDVKVNYSTTSLYQKAANVFDYQAPEVYSDANWPTQAQQIISQAGIEKQYLNRFDFDLQAIRMAPMVEVAVGSTENLVYDGIASKDRGIDLTDYQITMKSSNTAIATATRTAVTGVSAGTVWITMEIVRKDASGNVQFYDEHVFRVVVK